MPINGAKSMWCSVRANPADPYMCGWEAAPGYGENWVQDLRTDAFSFAGMITLSYHGIFDSEAGYDYTYVQYDAGGGNFGTQVVFFIGSPNPSSSYPGLYDTPFCQGAGGTSAPCQNDYIVSPVIDMTKYSTAKNSVQNGTIPAGDLSLLGGTLLEYTVYRDLAVPNLVFYEEYVRNIVDGCPGPWLNDSWVWYGENQDYIYSAYDVSHLVFADKIQVALTCRDMCDIWYLQYGNCAAHTPSPWFDQVRVERYKTSGPQWSYRDIELFQDNFPENEFNIESYVRADAAVDVNDNDNPIIRPGDSIVLQCTSPLAGGLALDGGHPAIYLHVKATYIGSDHAKPAQLAGPQLQGTYGYYKSDDGTWTIIQGDTAMVGGQTISNWYMFDLNDSLFTRGYKIEYYFMAKDANNIESKWPRHNSAGGAANNLQPYNEFTCLPTKNSDILYVDEFGERPDYFLIGQVEAYWQPVFQAVLPVNNQPDVYDVQGAASAVSNGPGSRAKTKHLTDQYNTIVWDSGNLSIATITDGTVNSDKSDDCSMLVDWMSLSEHRCGLWVCGDDVAFDLDAMGSTPALTLMSTWCGVDFVANSFFNETGGRTGGGIVTPLIKGDVGGIFTHAGVPDQFYAFGGCFIINQFDVLDKTANGKYALMYPTFQSQNRSAGIQSATPNPAGFEVRTMCFGFSYMYMRNDVAGSPTDRFHVAGQLVRTLVSDVRDAKTHTVNWDGTNDRGSAVASGIYFYKMDTKDFSQTKKMVMLR
ncbi:MAG: FlgD immunoglobulin-like domain containing protein [Candidatus Krumholzibacteriia bacterium]